MSQLKPSATHGYVSRKRLLRRFCLLCLAVFGIPLAALLSLTAIVYYLDNSGFPRCTLDYASRCLAAHDILFHADRVRGGFFNGLCFNGVKLSGVDPYTGPTLAADELRIQFLPRRLLQRTFIPFRFEIRNGSLSLPVFPESGKEGAGDLIPVTELNAVLVGRPGLLDVQSLSGKVFDFSFCGHGSLDNLLHAAGARGGRELEQSLSQSGVSVIPHSPAGLYEHLVSVIPLKMRRDLIFFLDRLNQRSFDRPPSASAEFHIDFNHFDRTFVRAQVILPELQYEKLHVGSLTENLLLKDGCLSFDNFQLQLDEGESISGRGSYNSRDNSISCDLSGVCSPDKILQFADEDTRKSFRGTLAFPPDSRIAFRGRMDHFSVRGGDQRGHLELRIPSLSTRQARMSDLVMTVDVSRAAMTGTLHSGLLEGEPFSGTFHLTGRSLVCNVRGTGVSEKLNRFLDPDAASMIRRYVLFDDPAGSVSYSGTLRCPDWSRDDFSGSMELLLPSVRFGGLPVRSAGMQFDFAPGRIRIDQLEAVLDARSKVSGSLTCFPRSQALFASLSSTGSPEKSLRMLDPEHKTFLESLVRRIEWPAAGNLMELKSDIFLRLAPRTSYFLTGSLVMSNFSYRGISFKYGASRFVIDSNKVLILPSATLESQDGRAVITACYDASDTASNAALSVRQLASLPALEPEYAAPPAVAPSGRLDFTLHSTLSGNDILRCLYPEWKSTMLDFPDRLDVRARGVIDYMNPRATEFYAGISNSALVWNHVPFSDVDADVNYRAGCLEFSRAGAGVCGGRLMLDYRFDFASGLGRMSAQLSDADLNSLLEQLRCKGLAAGQQNAGSVSGSVNADLRLDSAGIPEMFGKGKFDIRGADLWSIPLFGGLFRYLGYAWSMEHFGSITSIHSDFRLEKDRLITERFLSDGGIVALTAKGGYHLRNNEFDVRFRAELLRSALPFEAIPALLYPLSRAFERRLTGKFSDYKWE